MAALDLYIWIYVRRGKGGVIPGIPTDVVQEAGDGVGLDVDLGGQRRVVVDGGGAVEPRPVHVADEEGLEVGLHQLTGLLDEGRVDDLDAGDGRVRHRAVAARAPLLRDGRHGGSREGQKGRDAGELHLDLGSGLYDLG